MKSIVTLKKTAGKKVNLKLVLGLCVYVVIVLWLLFHPMTMAEAIGKGAEIDNLEVELIKSIATEYPDGKVVYKSMLINLPCDEGGDGTDEFFKVLDEIKCRRRIPFPFETIPIISGQRDSVNIMFKLDGKYVEIHMLEDSKYMYDLGTEERYFKTDESAFSKLAAVIEAHGTICEGWGDY